MPNQITFGKSAYLPGTPEKMLDTMESSELSITAAYEGGIIVTKESIEEYLEFYNSMTEVSRARARDFKESLESSLKTIDQTSDGVMPIGHIFFVS